MVLLAQCVLGIHGGFTINQHDAGACLFIEGSLISAAEEERYTRAKGSFGKLPIKSISACLSQARISLNDVDLVVLPGITYPDIVQRTKNWLQHHFSAKPEVIALNHQHAHLYSTLLMQPSLGDCIISSDAYGDRLTGAIGVLNEKYDLDIVEEIPPNHSLGRIYGMLTNFLGYRAAEEEFKVMGLSALGNPERYDLSFLSSESVNLFNENPSYYSPYKYTQDEPYYSEMLEKKIGISRRRPGEQFSQEHIDFAASMQNFYEHYLEKFLTYSSSLTKSRRFYFAGGTALNSLANYRMRKKGVVESLTIQPAASDRGLALGCATYGNLINGYQTPKLTNLCLGSEYSQESINDLIDKLGLSYTYEENIPKALADFISRELIIGIHRGRSEFGPRALGNRSILATPTHPDMKNMLNLKIKFRESYRPFACICPEEHLQEYFSHSYQAPFMTEIFDALPATKANFPSIVHVDGTCRVQSTSSIYDRFYSDTINELIKIGHPPLIINTSFNLSGEPIVETPSDAIRSFFSSAIDILIIGNFIITKN